MRIEDFLTLLEPPRKRQDSQGSYICKCPAHADGTESLHVKLGRNKRGQDIILVKCFAGCTREEILAALGLQQKDLTCDSRDDLPWDPREGKKKPPLVVRQAKEVKPAGQQPQKNRGAKHLETAYPYTDEKGELIFEACRYRYDDGSKTFRQRRPDPHKPGEWLWDMQGVRLVLYRLPEIVRAVEEKRPVWIVEGEKDADNLARLGFAATSSPMGAGKWRNGHYRDSLKGATCLIVPDNDKPGWDHARDIAQDLEGVADNARILDLKRIWPEIPEKNDVSDLIAKVGDEKARELLLQLMNDRSFSWTDLPGLYARVPGYYAENGCIFQATDKGGRLLCNFLALPTDILTVDDGLTVTKKMEIHGWTKQGHPLRPAQVPIADYNSMGWVAGTWDIAANIQPGNQIKDKLRYVIAEVGRMAVERRTEYTHTGWRKMEGKWAFLHGGGAIGADQVNTALEGTCSLYRIDGNGHTAQDGYRASRALTDVMAEHLAIPLLCCVYLAPLRSFLMEAGIPPAFAAYIVGRSGTRKSTAAALAMSHYGNFTSKTPPASFHDTANAVRIKAFALKDMPLLVDDYHPTQSQQERRRMEGMAQELVRAFGDNSDRGRMNADRTLQAAKPPRCLALMSGEDVPQIGESGLARLFPIRVQEGDVPLTDQLTQAQEQAQDGLLQAAMAGYIRYLAGQADELPQSLKAEWIKLRGEARKRMPGGVHGRSVEAVAHLMLGWEMHLMYGYTLGEVSKEQLGHEIQRAWRVLTAAGETQAREAREDSPENRYLDCIRELLASKAAWVQDLDSYGNNPPPGTGGMIGYRDAHYYYFMPDLCYRAVNEIYLRHGGQFPLSMRGVGRALLEAGIAAGQGGPTKMKWINGRSVRLMWIRRHHIDGTEPPGEQQGFLPVSERDNPWQGGDHDVQSVQTPEEGA